jgi:hypothetical protein
LKYLFLHQPNQDIQKETYFCIKPKEQGMIEYGGNYLDSVVS